jgi:FtsP/CotA-like multicopper oxidase with cupredoxin domain
MASAPVDFPTGSVEGFAADLSCRGMELDGVENLAARLDLYREEAGAGLDEAAPFEEARDLNELLNEHARDRRDIASRIEMTATVSASSAEAAVRALGLKGGCRGIAEARFKRFPRIRSARAHALTHEHGDSVTGCHARRVSGALLHVTVICSENGPMTWATTAGRCWTFARPCLVLAGLLGPCGATHADGEFAPSRADVCRATPVEVATAAAVPAMRQPIVAPRRDPRLAVANACERPEPGAVVGEPRDLRSVDGVLKVELQLRNARAPDGGIRYCYVTPDGAQSPTLRVHPGDLVVLGLKNELTPGLSAAAASAPRMAMPEAGPQRGARVDPCQSGEMSELSTNLHFHGMTMPPVCHQDEVMRTSIQPGGPRFEYRFRVPDNEPPGMYWYHPHIHGFSSPQVLGGASGAIIVEGIERATAATVGLPERVLVVRDQDLLHPDAPPSPSEPVVPRMMIDRDGDAANNGTGFGKPAKDLSINYVPVPYPDYPPARIEMRPGERQLWRVLNASSVTYLNLGLLFGRAPQQLGIVAIDGVPLSHDGRAEDAILWRDRIGVPPASRVEFIVNGPPADVAGLLVTRTVDTGQGGENDPNRALATVVASADAVEPASRLPSSPTPLPASTLPWLGDVAPVRTRRLYFSEKLTDPKDPNSATEFYITVDGKTPKLFDPRSGVADIVTHQGDVEDWVIENRTTELHAFHIHQIHFLLLDWSGVPVNEPFLRDTVNVPYYADRMLGYPSVRLRMDFRDPNSVGTFVYHCHLLEHEDGGMMGLVTVEPAPKLKVR